jgi:hypothetical protein
LIDLLRYRFVDEPQPASYDRLGLDFKKRTPGLTEKLTPFAVGDSTVTLCDLRHNTNGGAAHLRGQAESLISRKVGCHAIHIDNEIQRTLKRHEIMN